MNNMPRQLIAPSAGYTFLISHQKKHLYMVKDKFLIDIKMSLPASNVKSVSNFMSTRDIPVSHIKTSLHIRMII
jgi:hypothetical protein